MAKNLLIVESPAKKKTIGKFLGRAYTIEASMGHVRDLPKSTMGVDIEHGFEPEYITIRGKGDLIKALRKEAEEADKVYLATDPDREGEAISWHLKHALGLDGSTKAVRITFNEITKDAVLRAIKSPREINMDLVDAQQGRRVMDRLVGYSISPILWKKIRRGLSGGRVQSAALRMICDRDKEIADFVPKEYHTVEVWIRDKKRSVKALYYGENGRKKELSTQEEAMKIVNDVRDQDIYISEVTVKTRQKNAPQAFTTSSLQQEASKTLSIPSGRTMSIAQKLYEEGLITYLRTDSTRVSDEALRAAAAYIGAHYGREYVSGRPAGGTGKSGASVQDAHEAIRPTDIGTLPDTLKEKLGRDEFRLYQLIWKRFTASRMTAARYEQTTVRLDRDTHTFRATGSRLEFDGYLKVYKNNDDPEEEKQDLSFLKEGQSVRFSSVEDIQHFTEPPAHYTDASMVKALEEDGIGRPSTYASTIETLLKRNYIAREKKNLFATELGITVNDLMLQAFPEIVDTGFTAQMEGELDKVAEGSENWRDVIKRFWPSFKAELESADQNLGHMKVAARETDIICEKCGRRMVVKFGPHGQFLACPGFPECRNTKPYLEKTGIICPKCGGEIVKKRSRKGRLFYSCANYPDCDYASFRKPSRSEAAR